MKSPACAPRCERHIASLEKTLTSGHFKANAVPDVIGYIARRFNNLTAAFEARQRRVLTVRGTRRPPAEKGPAHMIDERWHLSNVRHAAVFAGSSNVCGSSKTECP